MWVAASCYLFCTHKEAMLLITSVLSGCTRDKEEEEEEEEEEGVEGFILFTVFTLSQGRALLWKLLFPFFFFFGCCWEVGRKGGPGCFLEANGMAEGSLNHN
jgi:hypothetical protein